MFKKKELKLPSRYINLPTHISSTDIGQYTVLSNPVSLTWSDEWGSTTRHEIAGTIRRV